MFQRCSKPKRTHAKPFSEVHLDSLVAMRLDGTVRALHPPLEAKDESEKVTPEMQR
jgi:hypothetical protein